MKLSVIIPSFNQVHFIGRTIQSILDQNDPDVEIIIIDGGSKDGTCEVVESFGSAVQHFISEKDRGQSDALNKGLALATGDFIGWQNSDDIYLPESFRRFRQAWDADTRAGRRRDVYFGNLVVIDAQDRILYRKLYGNFRADYLRFAGWNTTNQTTFFSGQCLKGQGEFDVELHFAMDLDIYLRLVQSGATFRWINAYLGALRIHGATKTSTLHEVCDDEFRRVRARHLVNYQTTRTWESQFVAQRLKERLIRYVSLLGNPGTWSALALKLKEAGRFT